MSSPLIRLHPLDFQWPTADPFLFCAFHQDDYPCGNEALGPDASLAGRSIGQDFEKRDGWRMYHGDKVPGFPGHPHRGFETITIVPQGLVDHADSLGAAGRYGNGDVQWLTTGRGVQHSEMFPLIERESPNPLLLFQIWLNLPAASKMVDPHFAMFWKDQVPVVSELDADANDIRVELIAGSYHGLKAPEPPPDSWASHPESHVCILLVDLSPGACWTLEAAVPGLGRMLYFYEGETIETAEQTIAVKHGLELDSGKDLSVKAGARPVKLLLLQGRPIGEPVAHYGPFVMNSREELQQAFLDYQKDQFGGWPWPRHDQVHDERGRFARYADGREEEPDRGQCAENV